MGQRSCPIAIIRMEGLQQIRIDLPNVPSFEYRPIPRAVAGRAFVDQPGVNQFAMRIEPNLAATVERLDDAATVAGEQWLRAVFGNHGPLNTQDTGHLVLIFRLEVRQDDGLGAQSLGAVWQSKGGGGA